MSGYSKEIDHAFTRGSSRVDNMSGYSKEIDHAFARIARVEKHLGIELQLAA